MPSSRSFPSGHSAAAFAFATGVGHVSPAAAVPLRALAALVAYSRVHTGVHYPADVLAGALIGTALAQLTTHAAPTGGRASAARRRCERRTRQYTWRTNLRRLQRRQRSSSRWDEIETIRMPARDFMPSGSRRPAAEAAVAWRRRRMPEVFESLVPAAKGATSWLTSRPPLETVRHAVPTREPRRAATQAEGGTAPHARGAGGEGQGGEGGGAALRAWRMGAGLRSA